MIWFCCQFHLTSIVHILFTGTTLCSTVFQHQNTFVISLGVSIFFIHKHVSHWSASWEKFFFSCDWASLHSNWTAVRVSQGVYWYILNICLGTFIIVIIHHLVILAVFGTDNICCYVSMRVCIWEWVQPKDDGLVYDALSVWLDYKSVQVVNRVLGTRKKETQHFYPACK